MLLFIMCGLPGSGKSTLAKQLAAQHKAVICSADDYYTQNGVYRFDPRRLTEAHAYCQDQTRDQLMMGLPVVVDNTSLKREHRLPYITMAREYGAKWQIVIPTTPWRWNPLVCQARCTHKVPLAEIEKMLAEFERDSVIQG